VNDDAIYDLVRESFKELATEARAADLMPATVRRMRRRTLSISIVAISLVAALLIGIPVAVAAAGRTRGPGSLPGLTIPSVGVAVHAPDANAALSRLREWGVVGRIERDAIVCDLRTVDPADDARLGDALAALR